jgi:tetratricopeptide (TPR) repeat protein
MEEPADNKNTAWFNGNSTKVIALVFLVIAGIAIYSYSKKPVKDTQTQVKKSPQEILIESKGLPELSDVNNNKAIVLSPLEKQVAEKISKALELAGDGKDKTKNKQTLDAISKVIQESPDYSDAYFLRATYSLMIGNNDYQDIKNDIDSALKYRMASKYQSSFDSNASIYALRSKIDILTGNYQQAMDDLETAVKVDLTKESDVFNTGGVKPDDNSNLTALQKNDLDLLVSKYPNDSRAYIFRGLFYNSFSFYDTQYYSPAINDLNKAISINPNSSLAYYFLGSVYQKIAFNIYAFKINGGSTSDYDLQRNKANEKSLGYFKQAISIDPQFADAYAQIAQSLYSLQRYSEALPYYDKVIILQPDNSGAYNDRGLTKTYLNNEYDAISDFTESINIKSKAKPDTSILETTFENRANAYIKVSKTARLMIIVGLSA